MRRRGPSVGGWVNHSSTLRYLVVPAPSTIVCLPSCLAPTFETSLMWLQRVSRMSGGGVGLVGGVDLHAEARGGRLQLDLAHALELAEVDHVADGDLRRDRGVDVPRRRGVAVERARRLAAGLHAPVRVVDRAGVAVERRSAAGRCRPVVAGVPVPVPVPVPVAGAGRPVLGARRRASTCVGVGVRRRRRRDGRALRGAGRRRLDLRQRLRLGAACAGRGRWARVVPWRRAAWSRRAASPAPAVCGAARPAASAAGRRSAPRSRRRRRRGRAAGASAMTVEAARQPGRSPRLPGAAVPQFRHQSCSASMGAPQARQVRAASGGLAGCSGGLSGGACGAASGARTGSASSSFTCPGLHTPSATRKAQPRLRTCAALSCARSRGAAWCR